MPSHQQDIDALLDEGNRLQQAGQLARAEQLYKQVLAIDPENAEAMHSWGLIAAATYNHHAAAELMRRSLMLDSGQVVVWLSYAKLLIDIHRDADAIEALETVIRLQPDHADAYFNLGVAMRSAGRPEEAPDFLRKAIALDPDYAEAYRVLTMVDTIEPGSAEFEEINKMIASDDLSPGRRYRLHYALANIYKNAGDKKAFASNLFEANRIQSECSGQEERQDISPHERISAAFTPENLERASRAQPPNFTPIFIVGLPRSGTTLVERILASHPLVEAGEELQYLRSPTTRRFSSETGKPYPEGFQDLSQDQLQAIAKEYTDRTSRLYPDAAYITDKNPGNFFAIGVINILMPNAKIIAIHRDPMDTCFSILQNTFTDSMRFCCNLEVLAEYYGEFNAQLAFWKKALPGFVLEVRYEDIIEDQEGQSRRLLEFCGLEWDDACLNFHQSDSAVRTFSAGQVRQPIYSSSIGAWKEYEKELAPLIKALGPLGPGG